MITFTERFKELLIENNLSPKTFGQKLELSPSVVCRWLNRDLDLKLDRLILLSDFFHCSIEFLSGRIDIDNITIKSQDLTFFQSLTKIMKEKGITEYRLTKDLSLSRNAFYNWKCGGVPRLSSLISLADYLGVSIDYLVGRE